MIKGLFTWCDCDCDLFITTNSLYEIILDSSLQSHHVNIYIESYTTYLLRLQTKLQEGNFFTGFSLSVMGPTPPPPTTCI